jgi:hypothetical protein
MVFLRGARELCAIIMDVRLIAIIAVAYVLGLNCTVRHFGGDAFPLSVVRLPEKTQAVLMLGVHSFKHLWNSHCDDPRPFVIDAARERGIPISFALSIARTESNFRSHSISSTGAMGVMQLMPTTARENGVVDPYDPEQNARGATAFLETLWKRYRGNRLRIAAAYNAGPGRVAQSGAMRLPKETQGYAKRVVARDKNSRVTPFAMNDLKRAPAVPPAEPRTNAASTAPQ